MKPLAFTSRHFPVIHLLILFALILFAMVGLSGARQKARPVLDKTRTFSISVDDNFVTLRNVRTGEVLSVKPVGAPAAPGTPPPPATGYTFQTLAAPAGAVNASAQGMNSSGTQIVGVYSPSGVSLNTNGLVYNAGKMKVLNYPGAAVTALLGINDEGTIVGYYSASNTGFSHAVVYKNGQFTTLNQHPAFGASADGISDSGAIVGTFNPNGQTNQTISVLIVNNIYSQIVFPGEADLTFANGINQAGEIVGTYGTPQTYLGFTDGNGTFTTVQVPGAQLTLASAISNNGNIAGVYTDSSNLGHGFTFIHGQYTTIDYPGATQTSLSGIDDAGDVVGSYSGGPCTLPGKNCAFLATVR
jgi:probable HAF family extracellular repeat protein